MLPIVHVEVKIVPSKAKLWKNIEVQTFLGIVLCFLNKPPNILFKLNSDIFSFKPETDMWCVTGRAYFYRHELEKI